MLIIGKSVPLSGYTFFFTNKWRENCYFAMYMLIEKKIVPDSLQCVLKIFSSIQMRKWTMFDFKHQMKYLSRKYWIMIFVVWSKKRISNGRTCTFQIYWGKAKIYLSQNSALFENSDLYVFMLKPFRYEGNIRLLRNEIKKMIIYPAYTVTVIIINFIGLNRTFVCLLPSIFIITFQ